MQWPLPLPLIPNAVPGRLLNDGSG